MVLDQVLPEQYAAARPLLFPSPTSFRWFVRQHRAEMVERCAVLMPTGRLLVDPEAFDSAVVAIGARQAVIKPK